MLLKDLFTALIKREKHCMSKMKIFGRKRMTKIARLGRVLKELLVKIVPC
jgi:hypothetical protein